jgi:hypothetical protein
MVARDINGLVLKQIESVQDILKIMFDSLKQTGGSLEQATEETTLLEVFELLRRESQRAGNAGCGKKESVDAHCG